MERFPLVAPIITWWRGLSGNTKGAVLILISGFFFSVMSVGTKKAGQGLPALEVTFFRAFFALLVILPVVFRTGVAGIRTRRPFLHLTRALFGTCGMFMGMYAIINLPLADAISISFARPLFMVLLAVFVLHEVIRLRRTMATVVGFIGVIVMLRPGGTIEFAAMVAVMSALFAAGAVTCVKLLTRTDGPLSLIFYSNVVATIALFVPMLFDFVVPSTAEWAWLVFMGITGVTAQNFFVRAYAKADAMVIAPYDYSRLLFVTGFGLMFFGDVPDAWTWTGAAIIIGSSLYIMNRENKANTVERLKAEAQDLN